jgi:hypothetical protein
MNAKQALIDVISRLPDSMSAQEIVSVLRRSTSETENRHPEWTSDEVSDEDWLLFVSQGLHDELADTRQDIYTLEDGQPYDVAR